MHTNNAISNEALGPISVRQGSTIGPFLLLTIPIKDLPGVLQIFCSMFTDNIKIRSQSTDVEITQSALLETVEWAAIVV